jgi:hypothetical protein
LRRGGRSGSCRVRVNEVGKEERGRSRDGGKNREEGVRECEYIWRDEGRGEEEEERIVIER